MDLIMNCFNGMDFVIKYGANADDLSRLAAKRERQGFEVTWLSPNRIEVNTDDVINDFCGVVELKKQTE